MDVSQGVLDLICAGSATPVYKTLEIWKSGMKSYIAQLYTNHRAHAWLQTCNEEIIRVFSSLGSMLLKFGNYTWEMVIGILSAHPWC